MLAPRLLGVAKKCKGCGEGLDIGDAFCAHCGAGGLFTGGMTRKPVTPYAVRKETFIPKVDAKKQQALLQKLNFKKLAGTLLSSAARDAAKMALLPRHRIEWSDVELKVSNVRLYRCSLRAEAAHRQSEIGEGAFAIVYEGMLRGDRLVAVKEMKYQEATADQLRDFAAEVSVLATLVHPNIVEFVGACMDPQHMLLVMELVGGGDAMILLARDDVQITWARR